MDNYERKNPKQGVIEERDNDGNLIRTTKGWVIGRGENKRVIDEEEVDSLARLWCSYTEIADFLQLPIETVKYNFRENITKGRAETKQALRKAQIKVALSGNTTMLIWLGKNILGQSDSQIDKEGAEPLPWSDDDAVND